MIGSVRFCRCTVHRVISSCYTFCTCLRSVSSCLVCLCVCVCVPFLYYCKYAIIFVYRYFHDFGLGAEICEGLILWFWCFHYYFLNRHKLKWKFLWSSLILAKFAKITAYFFNTVGLYILCIYYIPVNVSKKTQKMWTFMNRRIAHGARGLQPPPPPPPKFSNSHLGGGIRYYSGKTTWFSCKQWKTIFGQETTAPPPPLNETRPVRLWRVIILDSRSFVGLVALEYIMSFIFTDMRFRFWVDSGWDLLIFIWVRAYSFYFKISFK